MEAYNELQSLRFRVKQSWQKVFALADKMSDADISSLPVSASELQKIRSGKKNRAADPYIDLPWLT